MEKSYSIAEAAKKFSLNPSALRYYEKIGLMEPVKKNESGHRRYTEQDIRRINFIQILRSGGVSIETIKTYVDLVYDGVDTIPQRKQLLSNELELLEKRAAELQAVINILRDTLINIDSTLIAREIERRNADPDAYRRK